MLGKSIAYLASMAAYALFGEVEKIMAKINAFLRC